MLPHRVSVWLFSALLVARRFAGADGRSVHSKQDAPRVTLGEVNLVLTTDIHSWIEGREHEPYLNATLGHVTSFVEQLRKIGRAARRDIFFLDNGDINDGTALSGLAPDHVDYLSPLMQAAPYDALNLGNHELYSRSHGLLPGPDCPVVALRDSGYIASWGSRYLTSNVLWANSSVPVGNRYTVLEGTFGTKLLVFGFLYNMEDHCSPVQVENVSSVVQAPWFVAALQEHGKTSHAVVVLAHMHYADPLIDTIQAGIRKVLGPDMPVQFLAGHSHMRGWRRLDATASVFEAGCKLDTVGFTSFSPSSRKNGAKDLEFQYQDLDGNTGMMATAMNQSESSLLTPAGQAVIDKIVDKRKAIGANKVVGCASKNYDVLADLGQADSLWAFYMGTIVPGILFQNPPSSNPMLAVVGQGALIYNVYQGPFSVDDAYKASPFGNFWLIIQSVKGSDIAEVVRRLNTAAPPPLTRSYGRFDPLPNESRVPAYVNSSTPSASTLYDLIVCDFDIEPITGQLKNVTGQMPHADIFRLPQNTSSVFMDWFARHEPCPHSNLELTVMV